MTKGEGLFISFGSVELSRAIESLVMICTIYAGVVKKNRKKNNIELTPIHRKYHFAESVDRFSQKISPKMKT